MTQITARELNRDVSAAKRAADERPVIVTDRGRPAYVLMSYRDFQRLEGASTTDFIDRLRMPVDIEVDFAPVQVNPRVPEF